MNHVDETAQPEFEARIVAWVLGEASPFEAAELERLCVEQPELALFKRRIEAVHGLVGQADGRETQPLRLAPERRQKLLQAIGGPTTARTTLIAAAPRRPRSLLQWTLRNYGIAASIVFVFGLGLWMLHRNGVIAPPHDAAQESLRKKQEEKARALESQAAVISDAERRKSAREARDELSVRLRSTKPVARAPARPANRPAPNYFETSPSGSEQPPAFADALTNETEADMPVPLSSFEVAGGTGDAADYTSTVTLSGTRMNTSLRDVGSSITLSNSFIQDHVATNSPRFFDYTAPGNGSGGERQFAGWIDSSIAEPKRDPNSLLFGQSAAGERVRGIIEAENGRDSTVTDIAWGSNIDSPVTTGAPKLVVDERELAKLSSQIEVGRRTGEKDATHEHTIAPGDTLAAISQRYGVSIAELSQLNNVTDPRQLTVGAKLRVPSPSPPRYPPATKIAPTGAAAAPGETSTSSEAVSTFSLHVSDASFRLAQAALARGEVPDPARIRPEEFYNAFDYGDPAPTAAEKIAFRIEQAAHPFLQQRNLVRIAVRVPATGRGATQPLRLTVLLDTSGSMEREDRVLAVRRAMEVLGSLLGPNDRVTLIGFARTPRLLVEELPGNEAAAQLPALTAQTPSAGGTNLEAALQLAVAKAQQHFDPVAQNRIVLITDGAANLGDAQPDRLATIVTTAREQGLAFDACGVGTDGLDDTILEALTRQGDGRYYVLDSAEDADAGFARQLAGAFRPAAQNVKLQVRFNPARVAHYRLIGFEQHRLREEDFRNDRIDAAELAAAETAVAVYQVHVLAEGEGELGDVYVRFRDTAANVMVERTWTIPFEQRARGLDQATPTMQLAGVAALLAEKLQGGANAELVQLDELATAVNALRERFANHARVQELVAMFEQARRL